jgi:hypothetical protein
MESFQGSPEFVVRFAEAEKTNSGLAFRIARSMASVENSFDQTFREVFRRVFANFAG